MIRIATRTRGNKSSLDNKRVRPENHKQDHTTDHLINREAAGLFIHHRY